MKRRFYLETKDSRYTLEAEYMYIDTSGAVRFVNRLVNDEQMTVLAFGPAEWRLCGMEDGKVIQAIEQKG